MLTAYLELVNDLLLFKRTEQYAVINKTFSDATTKTLRNHLWYLGSELVPLALFSSKISAYEKRLMAQTMADSGDDWSVRGIKFPAAHCSKLQTKQLHELITSSSTAAMNSLGLDTTAIAATNYQEHGMRFLHFGRLQQS